MGVPEGKLRLKVLTENDSRAIHQTALKILAETGMRILDRDTVEILTDQGCRVTDDGYVLFLAKPIWTPGENRAHQKYG